MRLFLLATVLLLGACRTSGEPESQHVPGQPVHDSRIEDRRWLLVEAMGQPYAPADDGNAAFILFDSDASRVTGNGSCNNFFGEYVLDAGQRIRFGKLGATMMACADMTTEQSVMEALRRVDNYAVSGDQLSLNRARMAPLLRFKLADEGS